MAATITLAKTTAGGIPYTTMQGSPTFSANQDASTAKEDIIIEKVNLANFVFESFPIPEDLNQFIDLRRRLPVLTGVDNMGTPFLTKAIDFVPFNSDLALDAQTYVKVSIIYETAQKKDGDEDDPETFLTHTLNAGGHLLSYPAQHMEAFGNLQDGDFGIKVEEKKIQEPNVSMTVFVPTIEHTYSWVRVNEPPFAAIRSKIGKVNSELFLGSPKNTLLFLGVSASQDFTLEGEEPWRIDFKFSERNKGEPGREIEAGWNHFFHPKSGTWQKLKNANGDFAYEETTFDDLFKQGP